MTLQTLMQNAPVMYCYMKCWMCYYIVLIVYIHVCHSTQGDVKGQLLEISTFLPVCRSQEQNSGCQTWWQVSWAAESPHRFYYLYIFCSFVFLKQDYIVALTWTWTHRDLPTHASGVLGSKACAITHAITCFKKKKKGEYESKIKKRKKEKQIKKKVNIYIISGGCRSVARSVYVLFEAPFHLSWLSWENKQ